MHDAGRGLVRMQIYCQTASMSCALNEPQDGISIWYSLAAYVRGAKVAPRHGNFFPVVVSQGTREYPLWARCAAEICWDIIFCRSSIAVKLRWRLRDPPTPH